MPPRKPKRPPMPADVEAILDEMRNLQFDTTADAQRFLEQRMEEYNKRPQEELRGLSPDQVSQLMQGNWLDEGAMRLDASLSLGDLEHVPMLHNARLILRYVSDRGPVPLTSAGNLRRSAVAELLPGLRMSPVVRRLLSEYYKVVDETSVASLYRMRGFLESLGMLHARSTLLITPIGSDALRDENAGTLYLALFSSFFEWVQVSVEPDPEPFEPMGALTAIILYQLSRHARDWLAEPELYDRCWPADPGDDVPAEFSINPWRGLVMRFRVLEPLVEFGLVESDGELAFGTSVAPPRYRLTALFDRFVRFEFGAAPRPRKGAHRRRKR